MLVAVPIHKNPIFKYIDASIFLKDSICAFQDSAHTRSTYNSMIIILVSVTDLKLHVLG